MSDSTSLNRIQNFYGGITTDDRSRGMGVGSNFEELDIFSNADYMEPNTTFEADTTITRKISGYTIGDMYDITSSSVLYALGRDSSGTPLAQVWRKTDAHTTTPNGWLDRSGAANPLFTSAYNSNEKSPIAWHRVTVDVASITSSGTTATLTTTNNHGITTNNVIAITVTGCDQAEYNGTFKGTATAANTMTYTMASDPSVDTATASLNNDEIDVSYCFLYYVTGTNQLIRAQITDSTSAAHYTESTTDLDGVPMSLFGLGLADDRISMIRHNGDLFIASGSSVCRVGSDGVITQNVFSVSDDYKIVSMAPYLHNMAILCKDKAGGNNRSKIFYWDLADYTNTLDESSIAMGGPQILINFNESLWAICATNGILQTYRLQDRLPVISHILENVATETDALAIVPDATKFVKDNAFYFGVRKTDKSGLYAIGQVDTQKPFALCLAKRFNTTDYSDHTPLAATAVGDNWYASYLDSSTYTCVKGEGSSQTRSSRAIYETIWLDLNSIETLKSWAGFLLGTKVMPSGCSIRVDAKVDNNDSYTMSVSSITRSGSTATVTTTVAHTLSAGDVVTISGAGQSEYNKSLIVATVPTDTTFTYSVSGTPTTPATGTIILTNSYDYNSLKTLTSSNDKVETGTTPDTFWYREWTSVYGRMVKIRLRFTSSGTSKATVYFLSFLSRLSNTI